MDLRQARQNLHRAKIQKYQYPKELTLQPDDAVQDVPMLDNQKPRKVWLSRKYLVLYYEIDNPDYPNMKRLSICTVKRNQHGYIDGLTWDELNSIKQECGFGDYYAVEIYPRDCDLVNVANFRHLWILENPLTIGWFKHGDN